MIPFQPLAKDPNSQVPPATEVPAAKVADPPAAAVPAVPVEQPATRVHKTELELANEKIAELQKQLEQQTNMKTMQVHLPPIPEPKPDTSRSLVRNLSRTFSTASLATDQDEDDFDPAACDGSDMIVTPDGIPVLWTAK